MEWIGYTGSAGYVAPMWILSGLFILLLEKKGYSRMNMRREMKATGLLGWLNLAAGVLFYVGNRFLLH
ncbi:CLC_0170 family protein [Cohnella sp. GCM10027633]|uniref:CLC_0170 family protein n=1 Tax=unclassified Cohnella TaxID=2636738 RepID=UPI00363911FC